MPNASDPPVTLAAVGQRGPGGTTPALATVGPLQPPKGRTSGLSAQASEFRYPLGSPRSGDLIDQIIDSRCVQIEYQPIFDAGRRQIVAFEALSRGPEGPLRSPAQLFAAARAAGRLGELDWVCRAAAFRGLLDAELPPSISLFVNVEADSLIEPCPADLLDVIVEAEQRLRVIVELTGQAMSRYPVQILETARRARAAMWGVAMTDLEFHKAGVALLPALEPDVVKVDHTIVAADMMHAGAAVTNALAECAHNGSALLVERVETDHAAMTARALGASYKQGHLFGMPGPLPDRLPTPLAPLRLTEHALPERIATPWELLRDAGARQTYAVDQSSLDHLMNTVAARAADLDPAPVVAAVTQHRAAMSTARQQMFRVFLDRCPLIVVLGEHVTPWSDWRVRAADLPAGHPLEQETCFLMLSPGMCVVVAAKAQQTDGRSDALWDLALSYDNAVCRAVNRTLLATIDTLEGGVHA
jgi:EAL domain-containing protein (putative c-di-GMP-specific phosphodiesterase class I)